MSIDRVQYQGTDEEYYLDDQYHDDAIPLFCVSSQSKASLLCRRFLAFSSAVGFLCENNDRLATKMPVSKGSFSMTSNSTEECQR